MEGTDTLDLVVSKFDLGKLETNAHAILAFVRLKLTGYKAENYSGDRIAEAKKDKAELNAAAKKLNDDRIEYERKWMEPFNPVKALINEACSEIKKASAAIDTVVRDVEQGEKDEKRKKIELFFAAQEFDLVPLSKIFSSQWLNKTVRMKDVEAEILAIIQSVRKDLVILDRINEPEAKAYYLETLDLNAATTQADRIKANRERIAAAEKAAQEPLFEPEEPPQAIPEPVPEPVVEQDLPTQEPPSTIDLRIIAPWSKIRALRAYMDAEGIAYEKL